MRRLWQWITRPDPADVLYRRLRRRRDLLTDPPLQVRRCRGGKMTVR